MEYKDEEGEMNQCTSCGYTSERSNASCLHRECGVGTMLLSTKQKTVTITFPTTDTEATRAPFWIIIDPRQMMRPDVYRVASMVSGIFFSRDSAQSYLNANPHHYSKAARVYCHSGHFSYDYRKAWDTAEEGKGK